MFIHKLYIKFSNSLLAYLLAYVTPSCLVICSRHYLLNCSTCKTRFSTL